MIDQITNNLNNINNNIKQAKKDNQSVLLIAVTKSVNTDTIKQLYDLGLRDFGENRVQAFKEKYRQLPDDINWHFIGNLQRNKVKDVIGKALIHSGSSLALLIEINKRARNVDIIQDVLLEVNIANETTKHGFDVEKMEEIMLEIEALALQNIRIKGLMAMAPFVSDLEQTRPYFKSLKKIFDQLSEKFSIFEPEFLSMGMTNDYEVAIEEGSNLIRIGTAIFKE